MASPRAGWVDAIDTPTLRGVAAMAPYLIDGSASTLEAVIARAADGYMGQPFEIDEAQTADLVAWLRSL